MKKPPHPLWRSLRRLYYRIVPTYSWPEVAFVPYERADQLIRDTAGMSDHLQWRIYPKYEDRNGTPGWVYIGRRTRVTQ